MSDMTDITECNGCSLERGSRSPRYGFPKKLLVATSVVVIIAMCLIPTEARSLENRKRHQRKLTESMAALTKDTPTSLKRPKNLNIESYKNATKKITKKLRNTKRFFDQERRVLNETKEYRDGMPDWLPAVNFVQIHFHDYKTSRKFGSTITERKFMYLMPKLYKSLQEYKAIFERLINVQVEFPDDPFMNYKIVRQKLISDTLRRLQGTILEITDNMVAVNMPIPNFEINHDKLKKLKINVVAAQCVKNDYITFRGYGNLLTNWYSEFKCPRNKRNSKRCEDLETKLKEKKDKREKNKTNFSLTS